MKAFPDMLLTMSKLSIIILILLELLSPSPDHTAPTMIGLLSDCTGPPTCVVLDAWGNLPASEPPANKVTIVSGDRKKLESSSLSGPQSIVAAATGNI